MLKVVGASWMQIRISTWIIGAVIALAIMAIILGELGQIPEDGNYSATAYWDRVGGYQIEFWGQGKSMDEIPKGAARAYYEPHINETGWAILSIETQPEYSDTVQAYAAGMLEGSLSWQMIYWHWQNTVQSTCEDREKFCTSLKQYLQENLDWVKEEAKRRGDADPYWNQIRLFYSQLEGMEAGFKLSVKRSRQEIEELTELDFVWMNIASDLIDLESKFDDEVASPSKTINGIDQDSEKVVTTSVLLNKMLNRRSIDNLQDRSNEETKSTKPNKNYDCGYEKLTLASAFIKLVPEEGQLFVAHNSAGSYVAMLKMFKHYNFAYHYFSSGPELTPGRKISFSSYPGSIHSTDDFYVILNKDTRQELVVTGVPINVFNDDLWSNVSSTQQVLIGPRIMAANHLATNGRTWSEILSRYNSGTGNKEWAIVNVGKFEKAARIIEEDPAAYQSKLAEMNDLLWVAEQIPGAVHMQDESETLKSRTYWASYGLPYYEDIANASGLQNMQEQHGDAFSYNLTAIAQIFQRDQRNATSMDSVRKLMRSNAYKSDPLSYGNPRCAVGSRGDVHSDTIDPEPTGVTDAKVYSSKTFTNVGEISKLTNKTFRISLKELQKMKKSSTDEAHKFEITAGPAFSMAFDISDDDEEDDDLEPFNWVRSGFNAFPHIGHPDDWNFSPMKFQS